LVKVNLALPLTACKTLPEEVQVAARINLFLLQTTLTLRATLLLNKLMLE